jgi:hypothetical protein
MKKLAKLMGVSLVVLSCWQTALSQTSKKEKKAAARLAVRNMIDNDNYVFDANYVMPQTGESRALTDIYDLTVKKDSVTAFLPYFGRAYVAPAPDATDGGIKFTSTNFSYKQKPTKNGGWEIIIKPKENNLADWRDVQQMTLNISVDGYASLQVTSSNRDPITFEGDIIRKAR